MFWNLQRFGAPLARDTRPGRHLSLNETLARGVVLARRHPSVAQAWPVVFSKNRKMVKVRKLERLSLDLGQAKALGFLLSTTRRLSGDSRLRHAEKRLSRKASREPENFFTYKVNPFYQGFVERRTPREARKWALRMNTLYEDFESCFRKFCP